MSLQIHVLPSAELPIYRQIVGQVLDAVACGHLGPGHRLPSHRELAERLVVSPHTVEKAYEELKRQGLVRARPGNGTYVEEDATVEPAAQHERLYGPARSLAAEAHVVGAPLVRVQELLSEVDSELRAERDRRKGGRS